jgi:hypothetical protein
LKNAADEPETRKKKQSTTNVDLPPDIDQRVWKDTTLPSFYRILATHDDVWLLHPGAFMSVIKPVLGSAHPEVNFNLVPGDVVCELVSRSLFLLCWIV